MMNVNVNVKRKFKINGKEYNSIEEMPPDIRKAFEKAMASQEGIVGQINSTVIQTKIIFNGTEYRNIDAMPQDVRQLYEKVLKAAETGAVPANIITENDIIGMPTGPKTYENASREKQTKIEPAAFSPRTLIIGIGLILIIILLYFFLQGR